MELDFNCPYQGFEKYESDYEKIIKITFSMLELKFNPLISVSFVDDDLIHSLNKEYRGVDRITDVISFAYLDGVENKDQILRSTDNVVLGDIFICVNKAKQQAAEYGHSVDREMCFLFTHGLLHLLGYDHMFPEDEKIMFSLQDKILSLGGFYKMEKDCLFEDAKKARELSYSPYSHFAVGAALLCKDGKVFYGTNIENSSYPLCMCAERNALYNAMINGYKKEDFVSLTLTADCPRPCSPCGACRQVISELMEENTPIYMTNLKGEVIKSTPKDLLPYYFKMEDLPR